MSASADPGGGTNAAATSGTPLANTGAPIGFIFLVGLILLSAGLALVVWQQRPKKAK
jgi:LPXTG-motif cell wall-anchored protein